MKTVSCAINDEYFDKCAVYNNNQLDAVQTYRKYYKLKDIEMEKGRCTRLVQIIA